MYRGARAVLRQLPDEDIQDVVQTVFLKLVEDGFRRLRTFQGRSKLSTWLVTVARREALEFLEREKRTVRAAASQDGLGRLSSETASDAAHLDEAISKLPARDRLLVRLVYLDGASYQEAARALGAAPNSISPWLLRAKERLRAMLEEKSL